MLQELKKIVESVLNHRRDNYHKKISSRLKNTTPSIIASDCFGTFIYHDMGVRFNSPTVNLFISPEDFLLFVENLEDFLSVDVTKISDDEVNYPVGVLECNGKNVRLNFMHYNTFEQAREKWNERKGRIDYNNLFVILLISHGITDDIVSRFSRLPYENKLLIADKNPWNASFIVTHKIFQKRNYKPGEILFYKTIFSKRRIMDDIDYISFLNGEQMNHLSE